MTPPDGAPTPPAGLRDLHSAHHDSLGQAVVWGADGAQGSPEQPSLSGGQRGRGQRQAVQLCVGALPERPVDQRPLPLKRLLLTRLCGEEEEEEVSCGYQTAGAWVMHGEVTGMELLVWSLCNSFVIFIFCVNCSAVSLKVSDGALNFSLRIKKGLIWAGEKDTEAYC